jgi:2-keto-3-deoxy-L-rhamnonate aldolase RhmA
MKNIKDILLAGKKTAGAWLQATSPVNAEILANAGFDWLMIDMEHAPGGFDTTMAQVQAMGATNAVPLVRAPWNDAVAIKKILDTGVMGVLVPYVNTAEEALQAVQACKYPPEGVRGVAGSPKAAGYGQNVMAYLKAANDKILVLTAVETADAVANLDEILKVPGLDGIFIGPMDLATSMGYLGNPAQPEVQDAIAEVEAKVVASGKVLASLAGNWEQARQKYEKGYQMLMLMSDTVSLAALATQKVKEFKDAYP